MTATVASNIGFLLLPPTDVATHTALAKRYKSKLAFCKHSTHSERLAAVYTHTNAREKQIRVIDL